MCERGQGRGFAPGRGGGLHMPEQTKNATANYLLVGIVAAVVTALLAAYVVEAM